MKQEEKQYITDIVENDLNRIQNSIISLKSLQDNTSILIGTILLSTFGVILLGFLKPDEFSFKSSEVNFSVLVFSASTAILFGQFIINMYNFRQMRKVFTKMEEEKVNVLKFTISSIHTIIKPFVYMSILSAFSTLFLVPNLEEHKILFSILIFASFTLMIQTILYYFLIKRLIENIGFNPLLQASKNLFDSFKGISFSTFIVMFLSGMRSIPLKDSYRLWFKIIFMFLGLILLTLPGLICVFAPIYFLVIGYNFSMINIVFIILVLVLQFILIYPLRKYFFYQARMDNFINFYKKLYELKKEIIHTDKELSKAIEDYDGILDEFPHDVI
jgi:hypothetical protein